MEDEFEGGSWNGKRVGELEGILVGARDGVTEGREVARHLEIQKEEKLEDEKDDLLVGEWEILREGGTESMKVDLLARSKRAND